MSKPDLIQVVDTEKSPAEIGITLTPTAATEPVTEKPTKKPVTAIAIGPMTLRAKSKDGEAEPAAPKE